MQRRRPLSGQAALPFAMLAIAALPLPAHAWELNYAQGTANVSAGLDASDEFVKAPAFSFLQPMNTITFVGESSLMLLGLDDSADRLRAELQAEKDRIKRIPYSLTLQGMALPEDGTLVLRYVWGEGQGASVSNDGKTFSGGAHPSSVKGFEFALSGDPLWLGALPLNIGLGATHYTYQVSSTAVGLSNADSKRTVVRMPLFVTTKLRVLPMVFLRPTVAYDMMSTLGMIFGTRGNTLHWDLAAEITPLDFLPITAKVSGVNGSSEDSTLDTLVTTAGIGLRF